MTGALRVVAARHGARTVVETLRQEGLSRCSRPLRDVLDPAAVRLVVSHLGPGFVRGDRFEASGDVGPGASLIVAAQTATRVLGDGEPSTFDARYGVAEYGRLYLAGEATIAYAGASHRSRVRVDLETHGAFASVEAFAPHEPFERVASSLLVTVAGRPAIYDALVLTPATLRAAIGTAFYIRAAMTVADTAALVAAADAAAMRASADAAIRIGVGSPAAGGVALRATGTHVHEVRQALVGAIALVRAVDRDRNAASRATFGEPSSSGDLSRFRRTS